MSPSDPSANQQQVLQTSLGGIDCTEVIDSLVSRTASEQNKKLDTMSEALQQQQQQFFLVLTALQGLTQPLASVSKTHPVDCLNVSSDEIRQPSQNVSMEAWHSTGLNVPDGTQPTNNLRLRKSTSTASSKEPPQQEDAPAGDPDDRVSVAASNQWFQDLRPNSNPKHGAMADGDKMLEEDQAYWQDSLGDYGDPDVYGSEISPILPVLQKPFGKNH